MTEKTDENQSTAKQEKDERPNPPAGCADLGVQPMRGWGSHRRPIKR